LFEEITPYEASTLGTSSLPSRQAGINAAVKETIPKLRLRLPPVGGKCKVYNAKCKIEEARRVDVNDPGQRPGLNRAEDHPQILRIRGLEGEWAGWQGVLNFVFFSLLSCPFLL